MSVAFSSARSLIVVPAIVQGPVGRSVRKMALGTGATKTAIRTALLSALDHRFRQLAGYLVLADSA